MSKYPPELLNLFEKEPEIKHVFDAFDIMKSESDRGLILVACGFFEDYLKRVIDNFLIFKDGGNKFLDSLNGLTKISDCARALGLISEEEYHKINRLSSIRNKMAHLWDINFESSVIKTFVNDLNYEPRIETLNQRTIIHTQAFKLMMTLTNRTKHAEKERSKRTSN